MHVCADAIKISCFHRCNPSISCPPVCITPPSLTWFLFFHPPIPPPLHFFFYVHLSLTMGGLRLLHVGGVGLLGVIAGPGAHRNIQINAVTCLPLKSVFHLSKPTDAGRARGDDQLCDCLTFLFSRSLNTQQWFKYAAVTERRRAGMFLRGFAALMAACLYNQ